MQPVWLNSEGVPWGFWKRPENRRAYMNWLGKRLRYRKPTDWYKVTRSDFQANHGWGLLNYFHGRRAEILHDYLPRIEWKEWFFNQATAGFWKSPENRRDYMNWLSKRLGYKKPEDWYAVTPRDFTRNFGRSILAAKSELRIEVLREYYPDYDWKLWLFNTVPIGFWKNRRNRLEYLNWLAQQLGYKQIEDWYQISKQEFKDNRGHGLLNPYNNSPTKIVMEHFPNYPWKEWKFRFAPRNFWRKLENRKRYLRWLGKKLGYTRLTDWYLISIRDLKDNYGGGLLNHYSNRCHSDWRLAIEELYPKHELKEWLMVHQPEGFWHQKKNRQRYMQWLGKKLKFKKSDDWYKLRSQDFRETGGNSLLMKIYGGSVVKAIKEYMPKYEWLEWRFGKLPPRFFDKKANRIRYFTWLGEKLGFQQPEDWYQLRKSHFRGTSGMFLVEYYYRSSPVAAVRECLPKYDWKEWFFALVPKGFWDEEANVRRYMDWLGQQLDYQKPEDWYQLEEKHIYRNHGSGLFDKFNCSPIALLRDYMPEYQWLEWRFGRISYKFWQDLENRRRYMKWLGTQLGFVKPKDWYHITKADYDRNHGGGLVAKLGRTILPVLELYPSYAWELDKFSVWLKKQRRLYNIVKKTLPGLDVKWNFKHPCLRFRQSNHLMELDVYVPELELAFEYQGEQHEIPVEEWGGVEALERLQARDEEKRQACKLLGVTLYEVHHTWNGKPDTVTGLINEFLKGKSILGKRTVISH